MKIMPRINLLLGVGVIICLGLMWLLHAQEPQRPVWVEGKDIPATCPFGHAGVKQIPILYGLLAMDEDLQKQIDALEVWPGGCCVAEEKKKTVCPACRYAQDWREGTWTLYSPDMASFQRPLSPLIAALPYPSPEMLRGILNYYQTVDSNGKVVREQMVYWTKEPELAIPNNISNVLITQLKLKEPPVFKQAQNLANLTLMQQGHTINIRLGPHSDGYTCVFVTYDMNATK